VLTAISDGIVALMKEYYGRGPTRAKTYYEDDLVVCLLRGGFSRVEQTLLEGGRGSAVVTQALTLSKSSARPSRTRSGKGGMSTRTSLRTRSRMEAHASVSARLPEAPAWDDQRSSRSAAARRSLRLDEAGADDPQAGALGTRQSRQI